MHFSKPGEELASQLVVERVNPDVVLGVRPEVSELAFDGVAREYGAILSVLPLVREEDLVLVVFLPRGSIESNLEPPSLESRIGGPH